MGTLQRIKEYIDFKGVTNQKFEKEIGFSNGAFATQLKNNRTIGVDKLENILIKYPDINSEWLLTGKGAMLKGGDSVNESIQLYKSKGRRTKDAIIGIQEVPFYDLEATAGLQELFDSGKPHKVLETIKIPNLPKCDGALTVTGDSMYPLLKSGDIVLYKQTSVDSIFYGEMYLLSVKIDHWEEYVTVKYVQKSEKGDDFVKLVSQNQHHQPKDISIKSIEAIAMVKASVRFNTMF